MCIARVHRLTGAATGKKEGVSQTKLAGLRMHIAVGLHGVVKQTCKLSLLNSVVFYKLANRLV